MRAYRCVMRVTAFSLVIFAAFLAHNPARAVPIDLSACSGPSCSILSDTYYGGRNTYNNHPPTSGDVIGPSDVFDITKAVANRVGNDLQVDIYTNYVGNIGASRTGLGALFLGNGVPTYNHTADTSKTIAAPYAYDEFVGDEGRFDYAVNIPRTPSHGTVSGDGTVYDLDGSGDDVVLSYAHRGSFRHGQAVGVDTRGSDAAKRQSGVTATWQIDKHDGILSFYVSDIFGAGLLSDSFTLEWAMTCANDVILESTTLTTRGGGPPPGTTPLPAGLPLFAAGLGLLGALCSRKARRERLLAG